MLETERVNDEDLKAGDTVKLWCGVLRIVAIEPYEGPLKEIVFAIARCAPAHDFSLCYGQTTDRVVCP